MKAVALKSFRDKYTGILYAPGQVLTIERERFSEIREAIGDSYIAEIVDPDAAPEPEKPDSGEIDSGEIMSGTVQASDLQGSTPETESGGETPPAEATAPSEPPKSKSKRTKKE